MSVAWFLDGAYIFKVWTALGRQDYLDYLLLRQHLESKFCDPKLGEMIDEAYYFNADSDPPSTKQNSFHNALAYPPPGGPGLRVKLYWLENKKLYWPKKLGGGQVVHPQSNEPYEVVQQKAVDVGLAFHLMRSYGRKKWKKLFLAAGDGDFHEVVQHLVEDENVSLVLIGSMETISKELRPYASAFLEIDEEASMFARAKPTPSQTK